MSKPKHTTGPWHINKTRSGYFVMAPLLELAAIRSTLVGVPNEENQAEANARLIAAAPELLEVIKLILIHNEELEDKVIRIQTGLDQREVVKKGDTLAAKIAAVIAKAEGEKK